ncbi:phosphotransferase [Devriesea agamarum]|uniref:phosphotransferase n=1 Tax=Devriesea agamarum TaxID=472569 RepID=UPI002F90855B
MKIASSNSSGIRLQSSDDISREINVYTLPLTEKATRRISRPQLLAHCSSGTSSWILLEDVGQALDIEWSIDRALTAMRAAASLDVVAKTPQKHESWIAPKEYRSFEHHIDAGLQSIEILRQSPKLKDELDTTTDLNRLEQLLRTARKTATALDLEPHTFQHGDLNNSNMGFTSADSLMLIDWAQAGMAPIGSDIAVFLSGFCAFGGQLETTTAEDFDNLMIAEYVRAHPHHIPHSIIQRVVDLWSISWAIQVRLGAGLPAAWNMSEGSSNRANIIADVRDGLHRATRAASRLCQ